MLEAEIDVHLEYSYNYKNQKQRSLRYHDRIRRWIDQIPGYNSCSIPADGDSKVYCALDLSFHKIYLLQRFETTYGGFKTGLQNRYRITSIGAWRNNWTQLSTYFKYHLRYVN